MLSVEGYMMFRGMMRITPKDPFIASRYITGTWLYKPDTKCWYSGGRSFPEEVCEVMREES